MGVSRATVDTWLKEAAPALDGVLPASPAETPALPLPALRVPSPPAPWATWDEVRQTRETLTASRFLLVRRPDHLTVDEHAQLSGLLTSPLDASLRLARTFLEDWYTFWRDAHGQRRVWEDAHARYHVWRTNPAYLAVPALAAVIASIDEQRFTQVSHFLRHPHWEATNNGAERAGRAFRHLQGPHFNLRTPTSIEQALAARAIAHAAGTRLPAGPQPPRCMRGRPPRTTGRQRAA